MVVAGASASPVLRAVEELPAALAWVVLLAAAVWLAHRRTRAVLHTVRRRIVPWLNAHSAHRVLRALRWSRRTAAGPVGEMCRTVTVTCTAAAAGWSVAAGVGLASPVMASISAILSVQLSVHSSLKEGAQRIAASLAGILIAIGVWKTAGVHTWSIAVIAGASLVIGRLMMLGDGAIGVAATSLGVLVVGGTMTDMVVLERMATTVVGVVIGAALSPLASAMTPLERAQHRLAALSTAIADLLAQLGDGAGRQYSTDEAAGWLSAARGLSDDLQQARDAVDELSGQIRWSLRTPTSAVIPMQATVRVLEHCLEQVSSIARSLLDVAADAGELDVPEHLGPVLSAAAGAFAAHADVLTESGDPGQLAEPMQELREARQETVRTLRASVADTGSWLIAGSILTDVERMMESLDRSAPVLEVDTPDTPIGLPAVSEVLPVMKSAIGPVRRRTRRRTRKI